MSSEDGVPQAQSSKVTGADWAHSPLGDLTQAQDPEGESEEHSGSQQRGARTVDGVQGRPGSRCGRWGSQACPGEPQAVWRGLPFTVLFCLQNSSSLSFRAAEAEC